LGGSAFHARAPSTGNARSPSEDRRVAGTTKSVLEAERSKVTKSMDYCHKVPCLPVIIVSI